ncbi:PREDICTED: IQ domain-containing protein G-like [Nicrophorus vespilloides]|uniref:Dynein regulatory complex protein 9 n=1 Tax=Nicrophorus vespilloides TaxID=110193 RepID=A0ABM1NI10_NICVS|nr:PREDICTED: IQ domain-containing protein G-like [Nicrophorus vespilloides]
MTDLYNQRDMEMKKYQVFKEEKRLEAEEKAIYNANAIIIQAWWRGVMVRRKLGPYKPKKSRGRGKKQKK